MAVYLLGKPDADPLWQEVVKTTPCDCLICRCPDTREWPHNSIPLGACKRLRCYAELRDKKPGDSVKPPAG